MQLAGRICGKDTPGAKAPGVPGGKDKDRSRSLRDDKQKSRQRKSRNNNNSKYKSKRMMKKWLEHLNLFQPCFLLMSFEVG
jgi:hypothetical protein